MKLNIRWTLLPLAALAGVALAQAEGAAGMTAQEREQERERVQAQEPVPAQPPARRGASKATRQGGDMRHCLEKSSTQAIIRCAEPGRRARAD
jgi:hypothetical protein